jgi:uncharacterized protein (DUF302 family)
MDASSERLQTAYGEIGRAASDFQRSRMYALHVSDVVARLRARIEAAELWVLHEIDPQALLQRGGYAIAQARQILFFHPRLVVRLLAVDPAALVEAPLKFVVLELAPSETMVRWNDPTIALGRYGHPALAALGRELAAACEAIADHGLRA